MISYGSAIAAEAARCVRTLDPDSPLGQAMPVCGALPTRRPLDGDPGPGRWLTAP